MARGGPKSKGKLASALSRAQAQASERAKLQKAAEHAEKMAKKKASGQPSNRANNGAARAARERQTRVIPFAKGERVLLVGEGNFSFAHALVRARPAIVTPHMLIATAYDSAEAVANKYPDAQAHIDAVRAAGAQVLFSVDATALDKHKQLSDVEFDKIVFNFPHIGQGITDQARNVQTNQAVLLGFFRSSAPLLRAGPSSAPGSKAAKAAIVRKRQRPDSDDDDDHADASDSGAEEVGEDGLTFVPPAPEVRGRVLVTLRTGKPYDLWCLPQLATKGAFLAPSILDKTAAKLPQPSYAIVRSFAFNPSLYEGYEHRRTIGFKAGVSSDKNDDLALSARERGLKKSGHDVAEKGVEARTWEFELKTASADDGGGGQQSHARKGKKAKVDLDRLE